MKKLIIAVLAVLILAGGAVGALKWMEIGPFRPAEDATKDATNEEAAKEPPRFIDMEPILIPVFQGDRVAGTVQIELKLEASDAGKEEEIVKKLPRLRDSFVRDLYSFVPRLLRKSEQIDVAILKRRLNLIAAEVTGPGLIDDILVQSVINVPSR